jgi:hypothetical protein
MAVSLKEKTCFFVTDQTPRRKISLHDVVFGDRELEAEDLAVLVGGEEHGRPALRPASCLHVAWNQCYIFFLILPKNSDNIGDFDSKHSNLS